MSGSAGYSEYRDSGVPWIGEIPAHWELNRAKVYLHEVDERSVDGSEERLSVSHLTGVTPRREKNVTMFEAESYIGHKVCRPGDVVVNTMWAWMGALGVARHHGIVSPSYAVYRLRDQRAFDVHYLDYLLRTPPIVAEYRRRSTGIQASRLRLYPERFLTLKIPHPSIGEQTGIVRFLSRQHYHYARFLKLQRQVIARLDERRANIIRAFVTQGAGGGQPRPAATDWLAGVPTHWAVKRLKYVATILYGASPHQSTYNEEGQGAVLVNGPDEYSEEDFGYTRAIKWTTAPVRFAPRDALLFCLRGSTTGRLNVCHDDVSIGRGVAALVPKVDRRFFTYGMMVLRSVIRDSFRGSTFPSVTSLMLGSYRFPVPPEDEQRAICDAIEQAVRPLDEARMRIEREIALVSEHRAQLTNEVVMGRIDVRGAAAGLPDLASESEPMEDHPEDTHLAAEEEEELSGAGADAD